MTLLVGFKSNVLKQDRRDLHMQLGVHFVETIVIKEINIDVVEVAKENEQEVKEKYKVNGNVKFVEPNTEWSTR